jgi:replicative DNA helicase
MKHDLIKTNIDDLDTAIGGGIRRQDFIMIGGPPNVGTTRLASTLSNNAMNDGNKVLYLSLERTEPPFKLDPKIRFKNINMNSTVSDVRKLLAKLSFSNGFVPDSIVIEPMYLMAPVFDTPDVGMWERGSEIAKELKQVAIDYDISITTIVQTNRKYKTENEDDPSRKGIHEVAKHADTFVVLYDAIPLDRFKLQVYGKVVSCDKYPTGEGYQFKVDI